MKRALAILTASVMASSLAVAPAFAQGNSGGNGNGNAGGNSASEGAPGQAKGDGDDATGFAPGQIKGDDESARSYAPGQVKDGDVDPGTTASTGQPNFGTLISSLRSGSGDFSSLETDAEVEVVDVDDLIEGENRAALDNALEDSELDDNLPADLAALGLTNLDPLVAEDAVAARVEDDGSLTVFTDPDD